MPPVRCLRCAGAPAGTSFLRLDYRPDGRRETLTIGRWFIEPEYSVHDDYLVCLEDGRKPKSRKRYLQRHFPMTPDEYRAKRGLPADYPMVAPAYSAPRSSIAKRLPAGAIKPRRGNLG